MLRPMTRGLVRIYGYGVLGGLLLVYLALVAFLELGHDSVLRRALMVGAICVSLAATTPPMRRLWLAAPLALVAIIGLIVMPDKESPLHMAGQLFLWYLAACLFIDVLGSRLTTYPKLLAAVCLYVVAAIGFSAIYGFLNAGGQPSFIALGEPRPLDELELIYFSFVTQTTLGYGDIAPLSRAARTVAIIQATTGVLYLAVLVAAIVGRREPEGVDRA